MAPEIEVLGVVRDRKHIDLDQETAIPDGSRVRVRLVLEGNDAAQATACDAETEQTLAAIYRMRHQGRSVQHP